MPHRLCLLGKFSDVARANRLEADLPEVNLPLKDFCRKMSGQLGWPKAPARYRLAALLSKEPSPFAEGLTAHHGIEAEP